MEEGIAPKGLMCQLHQRLRHSWKAPRTLRAVHLGQNLLAKGRGARIGRMGRPITEVCLGLWSYPPFDSF